MRQVYFCWPWRSPALCSEAGSVWWTPLGSRWTSICHEAPRSRPAPTHRRKERDTLTQQIIQTVFQYVVTRVMIVARETHSVVAGWLSLQSSWHEATLTEHCKTSHSHQKCCWYPLSDGRPGFDYLKMEALMMQGLSFHLSSIFLTHLSLVGADALTVLLEHSPYGRKAGVNNQY